MKNFQKTYGLHKIVCCVILVNFMCVAEGTYAELLGCKEALKVCTTRVGDFVSACMRTGSQTYCYSQGGKYQTACNTAANSCTETYVYPQPKLVSILYLPPGDKSTIGYTSTNSAGTTETYSHSKEISAAGKVSAKLSGFSGSVEIKVTNISLYSSSIETVLQSSSSTVWSKSGNPIDHSKDLLTIWLNPSITEANFDLPNAPVIPGGPGTPWGVHSFIGNAVYNPVADSIGGPIIGSGMLNVNSSFITVAVSSLLNPRLLLPSQLVSKTSPDGTVVAGLLSMCKNRISESLCTVSAAQANGCGCSASDFASIINLHPFFDPAISYPTVSTINALDPNGARFVPVKNASGLDLSLTLQSGAKNSFTVTDTYNKSVTYTHTKKLESTAKIGFSFMAGVEGTYSTIYTMSTGKNSKTGLAHSQFLTLETTSTSCYQYVNVYQDTVFKTFLFENGSNVPDPCP